MLEGLRRWFMRNLGFKIVALLVAVVVWLGVETERQAEVRYPVPLEIVTESDEETVLEGPPRTVEVTFSGAGKDLLRLGDQPFRVREVLEPGRTGPRRITLDPENVSGGGNLAVRAVSIEPSVISLTVDRVVSKRVSLRPLDDPEPRRGYEVAGPVSFDPPAVTLIGARSVLADIDTVAVDLGRFRSAREDVEVAIPLTIPEHPELIVQPDSVTVRIPIREEREEDGAAAARGAVSASRVG
jgi:YbbR domain-containing protein